MEVLLLRHGQTSGNLRRAYIGSTDELLCDEGVRCATECAKVLRELGFYPDRVYASPLKRAIQTARICFSMGDSSGLGFTDQEFDSGQASLGCGASCDCGSFPIVIDGLREMDFGVFEGKTYLDMQDDPLYNEWVAGMCEGSCPEGECKADFVERTCNAFAQVVAQAHGEGCERVAVVAHGGTLMAVLSEHADSDKSYYDWHVKNCEGYLVRVRFDEVDADDVPARLVDDSSMRSTDYAPTRLDGDVSMRSTDGLPIPCDESRKLIIDSIRPVVLP